MKVTPFGRLALTAGIMAVAASGLVATPAYADPATLSATNLVGFGSDTTQDVMQELSTAIGVDKLASFNSTWTTSNFVQVRPGGPSDVIRAKGSGDGWKMLQVAEGSLVSSSSVGVIAAPSGPSTMTATKANTVGQIDYARASSKQGTASVTGEYVNIPFATDVVGIAVDPDDAISKIPLVIGSSTDAATVPSLNAIYRCAARYVYTDALGAYVGVGADATLPAGATTASVITPQIPVFGSGTAAFFIKALFNATDTASWANSYSCIKRVKVDGTTNIQEHDGAPIDEVDNAIGIYSIGQWVAQTKTLTTGVTDRTNGTTLMSLAAATGDTPIAPTTGSGATLTPNADAWPSALKRIVYNVVPYRKAADVTSPIRAMFVGTTSLVCTNTASIQKMGFAPLTATDSGDPTSTANSCGSINSANRSYSVNGGVAMTTAPTVTNVVSVNGTSPVVNNPFTVSVSGGVATHDMGGTVQILDAPYGTVGANVLGSSVIGEGQNITADIAVTPTVTGSTKLYAAFIPKLGGIKVTSLSPTSDADASFATVTVVNNSTTTKMSIRKPASIGGTVRVVAWINAGGTTAGGTVTLRDGTASGAVLATDTLAAGETGAVLNYTQAVTSKTVVAVYDSTSDVEDSQSSASTVTLSKATPSITWATLPAAPNGFVAGTAPFWANGAKRLQVTSANATVAPGTTGVVTTTSAHGLNTGDVVYFSAGTMPAPATAATKYYVLAAGKTTTAFKVSASPTGTTAVTFTTTGAAVKVWKQNLAPKVRVTVAPPAGVTLKPTGSVKVYIGTTSSDKLPSREITLGSSGLTIAADGTVTATLSKADLWTWINAGNPGAPATAGATAYLIIEYPGSDAFNTVTAFKQIKVTS